MKINTNSWHYKIAEDFGTNSWKSPSENFCAYFWQVVLGTIAVILICAGGLVLFCASCYTVFCTLLIPIYHVFTNFNLIDSLYLLCWALALEIIIRKNIPITWKLHDILYYAPWHNLKAKDMEPNILVEYLKAKKQKICPIIEFVEE